jgi:hypothetical protein
MQPIGRAWAWFIASARRTPSIDRALLSALAADPSQLRSKNIFVKSKYIFFPHISFTHDNIFLLPTIKLRPERDIHEPGRRA